jgi:hypothetical protein
MSLAKKLAVPPKGGSMDTWVAGLNETDREAVFAAARSPLAIWPHTELFAVLAHEGAPVKMTAFKEWRRQVSI